MKYFTAVFLSSFLLLIAIIFITSAQSPNKTSNIPTVSPQEEAPAEACGGENLLSNPSFEGEYTSYQLSGYDDWRLDDCNDLTCTRAQMAAEWHPYWRTDGRIELWDNIMPEYKPSVPTETPPRVRSGEKAQHYFSFWSTHEAGMYQQVTAVSGGQYCASIWGHAWSDYDSSDYLSDPNNDGDLYQRIGIDPTGGTDWQSPNIIWGEMRQQYDEFGLFSVEATAQAETITVFTWSKAWIPAKHNDVYWDDATLTLTQYGQVSTNNITAIVDVDEPKTITQTIQIEVAGGVTWTVSLDPTGTITPTLTQAQGTETTNVGVAFNTNDLSLGTFSNTITITFNPTLPNSPIEIPLTVIVVPEVESLFLPTIIK